MKAIISTLYRPIYENPTADIILNGEYLQPLHLRLGTRQGNLFVKTSIHILLNRQIK